MEKKTVSDVVTLARDQGRLTTLEYIEAIFEDFLEFHGDRYFADDLAIAGGVATLQGKPATVIGIQKDRNLPENIERNFGSPNPEGYRKVLCLVKQAEKSNRPVTTFADTAGTYCRTDAKERGEGEVTVQSLLKISDLKVPIISAVIGEGDSDGALTLAVADEVWTLRHTIYMALSSEGSASILRKDGSRAKEAAGLTKIAATELRELAIVGKVIPEVINGQLLEQAKISRTLQKAFVSRLAELAKLGTEALLEKRYQRFREY